MNYNQQELISVLMGTRYCRKDLGLLDRSVQSILAQTHYNLEFLICDDGSTPEACAFLDRMSLEDNRIVLVRCGDFLELPQKLNECLRRARGKWIARMDDDDFSCPERFEVQLTYLMNHPTVAFVGCSVVLEQNECWVGIRRLPEFPSVRDFLFVQPFIHPALLFCRQALEAVNSYCEEPRCIGCEDYDLLLRLYENGYTGANMPDLLFHYTIPIKGAKSRTMRMRINEVKTRFIRFKRLGLLPWGIPYAIKPVLVGLIPSCWLSDLKDRFRKDLN